MDNRPMRVHILVYALFTSLPPLGYGFGCIYLSAGPSVCVHDYPKVMNRSLQIFYVGRA